MKHSHGTMATLLLCLSLSFGCASGPSSNADPQTATNVASVQPSQRNIADDAAFAEAGKNVLIIGNSPVLGKDDAPITIIAYLDFQTPPDDVYQTLMQVYKENQNKVRIVYKHFIMPTRIYNYIPTHRALEAARLQGKFWEMAERLQNYGTWNFIQDPELFVHARTLGLNTDSFQKDMWTETPKSRILNDLKQLDSSGDYQQSIYINGRILREDDINSLDEIVEYELNQIHSNTQTDNPYVEQSIKNLGKYTRDKDYAQDDKDIKTKLFAELRLPGIGSYFNMANGSDDDELSDCDIDTDKMEEALSQLQAKTEKCSDSGTLALKFKINPDGEAEISVKGGSLAGTKEEKCILDILEPVEFPSYDCQEYADNSDYTMNETINLYTEDFMQSFKLADKELYYYPYVAPVNNEPKIKYNNPEVEGSIDKRIIQKVVRQHNSEILACYKKELEKSPNLSGRVLVFWEISKEGTVSKTSIEEDEMKSNEVNHCMTESIKYWRFPVPKGGGTVTVRYPLVFTPGANTTPNPAREGSSNPPAEASSSASPKPKPDAQAIKAALFDSNNKAKSCHPDSGTLAISMTLTPDGTSNNVQATSGSLKGSRYEDCILDIIRKYNYPKYDGKDIPVKYTMRF